MSTCPNYSSNDWKNLVSILGNNETEAHRVFLAHGSKLPQVKLPRNIKKDLKFRSSGLTALSKNMLLKRINDYNEANNTSHWAEITELRPNVYEAKMRFNFMPKYDMEYYDTILKSLNKPNSTDEVFTVIAPEDIIVKDGEEYAVNGEIFPSYEDAVNSLYQIKKQSNKDANKELDDFLKGFLSEYGITVNQITNFQEKYGLDGVAVSDMANKVINISKGRADLTTLPEEAAHFIVEMMGEDNALYRSMKSVVKDTSEYQEVLNDYSKIYLKEDGSVDQDKIIKEAIGKVLSNYLIKEFGKDKTISPKLDSLLDKIVKWIKRFFGKMDNYLLQEKIDEAFGNVSNKVFNDKNSLGLDIYNLDKSKELYFKMGKLKSKLEDVTNKMRNRQKALEARGLNEDDKNKAAAIKQRIQIIQDKIASNEIEMGLNSFLSYVNENELDFYIKVMNEFKEDPSKMSFSSSVINEMRGSVDLNKGLLKDVLDVIEWDNSYKDLADKYGNIIDETTKKLAKLDKFLDIVFEKKVKAVVEDLKIEGSEYNADELLKSANGDINFLSRYFGPLYASSDEVLRMVYKLVNDIHNTSFRKALSDGKDLIAAQLAMEKAGYKDMSIFHEKDKNGKSTGYLIAAEKWGEYNQELENTKATIAKRLGKEVFDQVDKDNLSKEELAIWKEEWRKFNNNYKTYNSQGESVPNPPRNEKFYELMRIPEVKAYYDVVERIHNETKALLPSKYRNDKYMYLLPQIRKDIMQTIKDSDDALMSQIKSRIKESFIVTEDDTDYGDQSKDIILDVNGKPIKLVPLHYVSPLDNKQSLSNDITSMYAVFSEMSRNFNGMSNRLDDIKLIQEAMGKRSVKHKGSVKLGSETYAYQALNDFVEMFIYGEEKDRIKMKIPGTNKTIDVSKVGDKFINFVRQNNLFMHLFTTISGYTKSSIDSKIEDVYGLYTTQESKIWAEGEFDRNIGHLLANINKRSKTNKMELIFEYNQVFKGIGELFNRMDIQNRAARTTWSDVIYSSYELFDTRVKGKLALAIYDNYRLVDGKFITKAQFDRLDRKDKWSDYKDKTLYNAYEVKGNKLTIKPEFKQYVTTDLENRVAGTIKNRSNSIDGMLNKLDKGAINRKLYGRMIMLHRGWLVSGAIERFKKGGLNYETGEFEEGYYRTVTRAIGNMMKSEGTIRQKLAYWKNLSELERRNVHRMLADLAFTVAVYSIYMLLNNIADDDEDDSWFVQYLAYQSTRIFMEQVAFQNPTEVLQILNSPTPATSTLESIKDLSKVMFDWSEIETGPYKGMHKFEKIMIKNSLMKNLYEMQFPGEKNRYVRTQII